jgi:hypothetical protein
VGASRHDEASQFGEPTINDAIRVGGFAAGRDKSRAGNAAISAGRRFHDH